MIVLRTMVDGTKVDMLNPTQGEVVGTENFLYLYVLTPQLPNGNMELMDVIFLIHGGGFAVSSGNNIGTDRLMDEHVVVVTVSYRLGPLGFLSGEDLVSPGNKGLKDQNLGGDPNKITISGCSAGGASVHFHLLSTTSREHPKREAVKLASAVGCATNSSDAIVECLKQKPADHIVLNQKFDFLSLHPHTQFTPSVEPRHPAAFLDKSPMEAMVRGETSDVPILSSFSQDGCLPLVAMVLTNPNVVNQLEENWTETVVKLVTEKELSEEHKTGIGNKLKERYLQNRPIQESERGLAKMMCDWGFKKGIEESIKMMAKMNKAPIYSYQFAYRGKIDYTLLPQELSIGVSHCEQTFCASLFMGSKVDEGKPMSEFMINLTMKFIKGEPLAENWKPVKDRLPKYSLFKISSTRWNENELEEFDDFSNAELLKSTKHESHRELR